MVEKLPLKQSDDMSAISYSQSPVNVREKNEGSIQMPPPLPLLPKTMKVVEKPPESVVKGIQFR